MNLYVKQVDMPLSCRTCEYEDVADDGACYCKINNGWTPPKGKRWDCPLIELTELEDLEHEKHEVSVR